MNPSDQFQECPLCSSNQIHPLIGYEQNYLVKCSSCHFVFCQKRPAEQELKTHYSLYPRENDISKITLKRYDFLLNALEPYRKTNNIIDVGCGDGFFLEAAKRRDWNVYGTEFTQEAIKVCRDKGIVMNESPLQINNYKADFFDVITSFEVIEHINTPVDELNAFAAILRKGGVVYITTPNFNSISRNILKSRWNMIEYPEHLSYFTTRTLSYLFQKNNFKRLKISTTGFSINRLRASSVKKNATLTTMNSDELLRQKTEDSFIFKFLKFFINWVLNFTRKGDGIKALFEKR